jgi:hypothetical protein
MERYKEALAMCLSVLHSSPMRLNVAAHTNDFAVPTFSETGYHLERKVGRIQSQRWNHVLDIFLSQIKQRRRIMGPTTRPMQCPVTLLDVIHQI